MTGEETALYEVRIKVKSEEEAKEIASLIGFEEGWALEESKGMLFLLGYTKKPDDKTLTSMGKNYEIMLAANWEEKFKESFKGILVEPFFICPPWIHPEEKQINIIINPGSGFGTGEHPSTQGILKELVEMSPIPEMALDVGCGSGILSIACIKLGVSKVFACDIDPLAITNAKENFELNHCSTKVYLITGSPTCIKEKFPLVMANIDFFTLVTLRDQLTNLVGAYGHLILSGFFRRRR